MRRKYGAGRNERRGTRRRYHRYRGAALPAAQALARQINTIVAVTGEVDYVTDGQRTRAWRRRSLMTRVVGTGCALSAVVAASTAMPGDRLENVASACG
jgi:hydroxyethylthiazole kinase